VGEGKGQCGDMCNLEKAYVFCLIMLYLTSGNDVNESEHKRSSTALSQI
jgi:hypothetical protein